jgi:DNA-directed RNA polymerase subunit omega
MARITVEDCLGQIGNANRFSLIHLAIERVKQHRKGQPFLVECKNKEIVATLREIASGDVSFDNIHDYKKKDKEIVDENEADENNAENNQPTA